MKQSAFKKQFSQNHLQLLFINFTLLCITLNTSLVSGIDASDPLFKPIWKNQKLYPQVETVQNKDFNLLSSHPELKATEELQFLDYVIAALNGLNSDKFVPNSKACAKNARNFTIDAERFKTKYESTTNRDREAYEQIVFNATAAVSGYLPDAIYYCYFIPDVSFQNWKLHYQEFENLQDFEGAFMQNIAGNILTFIDIYDKALTAQQNGDFLMMIEQLARFVRRLLDFKSMQRETLINDLSQMSRFIRLLASTDTITPNNLIGLATATNITNRTDPLSRFISVMTGFVDGSFQAKNTSLCRKNLLKVSNLLNNLTTAVQKTDENNTVYYSTRLLKYMHPSLFHCYYAEKEAENTLNQYLEINSGEDISYNALYKTGQMVNQVKIMAKMIDLGQYTDRQLYVIARAAGTIVNLVLSPYNPRIQY
ncbi:UNKNOWN [Stylonychia lemnae]|uniref:Uncharacterized protein n=1 Tax=Stylonychia lemnae TaxID=5949 RepID=A0A078AMY9_STYLE|nr:UNKNOWN [Stylonychia lemnae]|eukprot:CDW83524.1 UNKNOWN [Stylonychia lemnae]